MFKFEPNAAFINDTVPSILMFECCMCTIFMREHNKNLNCVPVTDFSFRKGSEALPMNG